MKQSHRTFPQTLHVQENNTKIKRQHHKHLNDLSNNSCHQHKNWLNYWKFEKNDQRYPAIRGWEGKWKYPLANMLLSVQETTIRSDVISSKSSHATFKNAFKKNMPFVTCHLQQNGTVFVRANQLLKKNQSTAQVVVRTNQQKFCLTSFFVFSSFIFCSKHLSDLLFHFFKTV